MNVQTLEMTHQHKNVFTLTGITKKDLKKQFDYTYKISNKFILTFRKKGVYSCNLWMIGEFSGTSLPEEKDFYSTLNMKNNNGGNYRLAKRV